MSARLARTTALGCLVGCLVAMLTLGVGAGCGKKTSALATLEKADGPVERQQGAAAWGEASVGAKFFQGDAARTADGGAQLAVLGGARIAMQPHTVLRFGGKGGANKIGVELGAIELSGTGNYGLDVGDVRLSKGTVRITAKGNGESTVELTVGDAQVSTASGQILDLVIGSVLDLSLGDLTVQTVDAGVADAAVADAPIDAPPPPAADEATIEVTGKKAEVQAPGSPTWTALPAGAGVLAPGSKVRVGTGTTAKLVARGTTLAMAGGSRAALGADQQFTVELGVASASVPAGADGQVAVPGGGVAMKGEQIGAEARIDVNARESRINAMRGNVELTGANGGNLKMARGETATLAKGGTIRVIEAIPNYWDFRLTAGESATIHDAKGATAVQFQFGGKCADGGFIEMDRDARFRTAKVSGGKEAANMMVGAGGWAYRLRCSTGSGDSAAVASGRVVIVRDAGSRALPTQAAVNDIDADGRTWRISYQSVIPTIAVKIKGSGARFKLHVATGGKEQSFDGAGPTINIPGKSLEEGTYTYWVDRDGVKDPKVSTLVIDFDNTAPQVYIEKPANNTVWDPEILVRGAVLPGWNASVDGITIPIDKQRRFSAKVGKPPTGALAIKLAHPQRGVHYYLRRGK